MTARRDITVERDEDGSLVVRWTSDDDSVVVAVGTSPDPADHRPVGGGSATGTMRLAELPPGRVYVSLVPGAGPLLVVAERRIPFTGVTNVRDLGGYPTVGGGTTRWGRVYRADALHKLTMDDLDAFAFLGVRTVYDLRGDAERDEFPGPFPSYHLPIIGRPADGVRWSPPTRMTEADGEILLRDLYVGALEHSATNIGTVLRGISGAEALPVVFHCHAGKDRTGVVAAVLLLALGVDRETVLDDYETTRRYRLREHQEDTVAKLLALGVSPEAAAGVLGTPRWAMAAALDALEDLYGGVDAYLTGRAGLSPADLAALRQQLVEPPAA